MRRYTLRLDENQDADLVRWLDQARAEGGYGAVSRRLREALRAAYEAENRRPSHTAEAWQVDLSALLPQIRSTVEAAVMSVLGQIQLVAAVGTTADTADEAEALLDGLSADLLLDEEDSNGMA